jgi:hypothetical protein
LAVRIAVADLSRNHKPLWWAIIVILAQLVESARRASHPVANAFDRMLPSHRYGRYDDVPSPDWFKHPPPPF